MARARHGPALGHCGALEIGLFLVMICDAPARRPPESEELSMVGRNNVRVLNQHAGRARFGGCMIKASRSIGFVGHQLRQRSPRVHQREAKQVLATPPRWVLRARVILAQSDAPDDVPWRGLDQHLVAGGE
jgi:hypothetical protein